MSVSEIFEIPKYYYFQSGNNYSGSKGDFSYKIANGEKLELLAWHGKKCSMLAEIENREEFEHTEEGFMALVKRLEEIYKQGFDKAK